MSHEPSTPTSPSLSQTVPRADLPKTQPMQHRQNLTEDARHKSFARLCLHNHEILSMQQSEATKNNQKQ
jgi:hypothetical protein